jgi:hypothetical protein
MRSILAWTMGVAIGLALLAGMGGAVGRGSAAQASGGVDSGAAGGPSITMMNANICEGATAADAALIQKNQYGPNNASGTHSAEVLCPLDEGQSAVARRVSAKVYARNSTVPLSCTLTLIDSDGNATSTQPVPQTQSVSGAPGSAAQTLSWSIPFGISPNLIVDCQIPPVQAGAFSSIAAFLQQQ